MTTNPCLDCQAGVTHASHVIGELVAEQPLDANGERRLRHIVTYTPRSVSGSFETNDVGKPITISSPQPHWWQPVRRWRRKHRPLVLGRIAYVTNGSSVWLCDRNPMPRIRLWRGWRRHGG